MTERLGFNDMLTFLALAGIAAFAVGTLLVDAAGYKGVDMTDKPDLKATGAMVSHLGLAATGTAIVLAAIRAEGHSTVLRAIMLILGVALIFKMFTIGFSGGISA